MDIELKEMTYDQELAWEVESRFRQFMAFPHEHAYTVSTLWVLHTHVRSSSGAFQPAITPRLYFGSKAPGCGKSLATRLVVKMSHNGELVLEPTAPSMTSLMNVNMATVGFEEVDLYFGRGTGKAAMRAILNGGYEKGARVTKQRSDETVFENTHGPICLNGKNANLFLNSENFATLRSRTIPIILERKPAGATVDRYNRELHDGPLDALMRRLKQWGLQSTPVILATPVEGVMPVEIANRAEELWTIMFRIAHHLGGDWPDRCTAAARAIELGEWGDDIDVTTFVSPSQELLEAMRTVFGDDHEFLPTSDVIDGLQLLEARPSCTDEWVTIRSAEMGIARLLSKFGIESVRRMVDGFQSMGYTRRSLGMEPVGEPQVADLADLADSADLADLATTAAA